MFRALLCSSSRGQFIKFCTFLPKQFILNTKKYNNPSTGRTSLEGPRSLRLPGFLDSPYMEVAKLCQL